MPLLTQYKEMLSSVIMNEREYSPTSLTAVDELAPIWKGREEVGKVIIIWIFVALPLVIVGILFPVLEDTVSQAIDTPIGGSGPSMGAIDP